MVSPMLSALSGNSTTSPASSASSSPRSRGFLESPTFGGSLTPLDQRLASLPWPSASATTTTNTDNLHARNLTKKCEDNIIIPEEDIEGLWDAGANRCKGRVATMRGERRRSSHDLSFDEEEAKRADHSSLPHSGSLPDIQACLQLDLSQRRPDSLNQGRPVSSTSARPSSIVLLEASNADGRWLGIETSREYVHAW
jgi:hypothetical protein